MSKTHVPLDQVRDNPHQVRIGTGDLDNLAQSILAHGLRQLPEARLLVEGEHWTGSYSQHTKQVDGQWRLTDGVAEFASGHRRAAAVQLLNDDDTVSKAQLTSVGFVPGYLPVDLQRLSDEEMLDVGTAENLDRQDLSPIEEARLIQEHVDAGRSLSAIAPHFGDRSESWVSNRKRLLELPVSVQEHVHEGEISVRQAQALARGYGADIDVTPDGLVEKALRGADSGWLREEVEAFIERVEESRSSSPQDFPCAFCKAEAEEPCTTRDGKKTDSHSAREKAYDAWQDGRLEYGSVTADHLRRLISPPSTEVNYRSDEYTLADLVAAHQVIRGYDAPARSGHKGRSRKIRVEMQRRVDPNGKVNTHPLSAEEVIRSAPKELRDRLADVRTMDLKAAIDQASEKTSDSDRPELPEEWQWDEGCPEASVHGDDGGYQATRKWRTVNGNTVRSRVSAGQKEKVIERAHKHENNLCRDYFRTRLAGKSKPSLPDRWVWEVTRFVDGVPQIGAFRYKGEPTCPAGWSASADGEDVHEKAQEAIRIEEKEFTYEDITQSDDSREAREENSQGDGAPASSALSKADADSGERGREGSSSRSRQDVEGGEARRTEQERGDAEGAPDQHVSGDGAPSSDSSTDHPAHLPMVIDTVEADGHDWKLQSLDEGRYQGTVQNGRTGHMAEGTTPAEALQAAWQSAQGMSPDEIGSVDASDVDQLLSADGTEMWDDQAAEEASIASLLVAHRVAGERQETWRTKLITEAVEERAGRVTGDDVPEDVLEEVQAEVERRLEPVEA